MYINITKNRVNDYKTRKGEKIDIKLAEYKGKNADNANIWVP